MVVWRQAQRPLVCCVQRARLGVTHNTRKRECCQTSSRSALDARRIFSRSFDSARSPPVHMCLCVCEALCSAVFIFLVPSLLLTPWPLSEAEGQGDGEGSLSPLSIVGMLERLHLGNRTRAELIPKSSSTAEVDFTPSPTTTPPRSGVAPTGKTHRRLFSRVSRRHLFILFRN